MNAAMTIPAGALAGARRTRPVLALGAPMVAFFLIQTVVGVLNVGVLGRIGTAAIAGVGIANAVYTAICALLWGVDTGVQAVVSRTTGAGQPGRIADVLAAAHAGAIPLALAVGAATWAFGPQLVQLILPDRAAAAAGGAWIAAAAPSLVLLAVTLPINAAWVASGRPMIAAAVTAVSAPVQVGLTWLFVLGARNVPGLGAPGAALAMDTVMLAQVVVQALLAFRVFPGFPQGRAHIRSIARIVMVGWPISAQQSLLQVALMAIFAIVAQLGATSVAIMNVLLTLTSLAIQFETGLGAAAATLVGQTLGRGDVREARAWGWRATAATLSVTAPMGVALMSAPHLLLSMFLHDPTVLAAAIPPARIAGFATAVGAPAVVLGYAFRGAGATKIAAAVPFISLWIVELPIMAWVGMALRQGLSGIIWVQAGVGLVDGLILGLIWASATWARVEIDVRTPRETAP